MQIENKPDKPNIFLCHTLLPVRDFVILLSFTYLWLLCYCYAIVFRLLFQENAIKQYENT